EGFVGDSAILFCSIPESEIQDKIEVFEVHCRDDEGKKVCDIIGGSIAEDQKPKYKDRVETFPEEYKKGNFSIKLSSLQKTDARKYHCFIKRDITSHDTFQKEVITELHVKGVYNLSFIDNIVTGILFFMFVAITFCVARVVFSF
uniref:Immunoglobulin V-set domain-containing protein n=1 Tax=Sinocyclocheilus grahami TaxID=75366 RepID=A0A672M6B4_SINGR